MVSAQYTSVALWIIRVSLYIVPFIPLYIASSLFFPFITGKAFVFRTVVEIAFAAWLWLVAVAPEYRPRKGKILLALLVFILILIASTIFSENLTRSFWSNFERMEGLLAHLHLFAYFLMLSTIFERKHWLIFFNLFVIAGFFENIYVVFQALGYIPSLQGITRADGTIGNPTYLAAYLLFVIGFSLLLRSWAKDSPWRYWYNFTVAFSLFAMYFTASRGISVGLFVGILAFVALMLWPRKLHALPPRYRFLAISLLGVAVLFAGGLYLFRTSSFVLNSPVLSRIASISLNQGAARFKIWEIGWRGFQDYPIFGRGMETYANVFPRYYNPALFNQEPWFDRSHNIVLDWLNSAGMLGFFAYVALFVAAGLTISGLMRMGIFSILEGSLVGGLLVAYVAQNFFVFDQLATYVSFIALLAYLASSERTASSGAAVPRASWVLPFGEVGALAAAFVLAFAFVTIFRIVVWQPLQVNLALIDAMRRGSTGDLSGAVAAYERSLGYSPLGRQEVREQFAKFGVQLVGATNITDEQKLTALQSVLREAQANVAENSLDPRGMIYLGTFLTRVGLNDAALNVFEKARSIAPKKQHIYFGIAEAYFMKNDFASAIPVLKIAFELDPRFDTARQNLIAAYILNGDQKSADALLTEGYERLDPPIDLLVAIYQRVNNFVRLEATHRSLVVNTPANTRYRIALAKLLATLGRRVEAIKSLREAVQAIPEFAAEGEILIEKLQKGESL